jgi:peroxiredoxin Q/BCP
MTAESRAEGARHGSGRTIAAGDRAPEFTMPSTEGDVTLQGLIAGGSKLVLAFYAEDGTPSCRTQVAMLKDAHEMIGEFGARVLAVSADSLETHRAFAEQLGSVPFALASDSSLAAARAYGVVDEGDARRSRRAVFVIGADGIVALALPHFQPGNIAQFEAIFAALGMEA